MDNFLDETIPEGYIFSNFPVCRTRREACAHYLGGSHFIEPQPPGETPTEILHQIDNPFSMGSVINRQTTLQKDGSIRKSTRIGRSNLSAEKHHLEQVAAGTSVPVPRVRQYYTSVEFEHLVMDNMPGITLEKAWPTLSPLERESVADQVVSLVQQLRELRSSSIDAAQLFRKPFPAGLRGATDLNKERIKSYLSNEKIAAYVNERSAVIEGLPNVFTHGDLDPSNILIADKRVCGIIDWELSGFFPPYWEWVMVKRFTRGLPEDSWFALLEKRLGEQGHIGWQGMWEIEQLIMALDNFSAGDLTPEGRHMNRTGGWAEVVRILGPGVGDPLEVTYATEAEHPFWLELAAQEEAQAETDV